MYFFFLFHILTLLAFHSAWPEKKNKNPNNKLTKHTTFILFSDLIPVCSFWVVFFFFLLFFVASFLKFNLVSFLFFLPVSLLWATAKGSCCRQHKTWRTR